MLMREKTEWGKFFLKYIQKTCYQDHHAISTKVWLLERFEAW